MSDTSAPEGMQFISLAGNQYAIKAPYAEGHTLTANEAHALNQLRAENVRNNMNAQFKKAAEENKELPTADDVSAYDDAYEFGSKKSRIATSVDPVGAAERKIVEATLRAFFASKGQSWKNLDKDQKDAYIQRVVDSGRYRQEAEEQVAADTRRAAALGDLMAA